MRCRGVITPLWQADGAAARVTRRTHERGAGMRRAERCSVCPHCHRPLPPGWKQTCRHCGLEWDLVERRGTPVAASPAPRARLAIRPSLAELWWRATACCVLFGLGWFALTGPIYCVPGGQALVVLAALVGVPLGLVLIAPALAVLGHTVLRIVLPERIESAGDVIHLRIVRSVRRSDAWIAKAAIRAVELRGWQLGMQQVWLVLASGAACRVSGAQMPLEAHRFAAKIGSVLASREVVTRVALPAATSWRSRRQRARGAAREARP
jgi:hypothetical protein